jgi:hypothetical protein
MGAILTITTKKEGRRERERKKWGDYSGPISIWHAILFIFSKDKVADHWSIQSDTGNPVH